MGRASGIRSPEIRGISSTIRGGGKTWIAGSAGSGSGWLVTTVSCAAGCALLGGALSPRKMKPSTRQSVMPEAEMVRPIVASLPEQPARSRVRLTPIWMWRTGLIANLSWKHKVIAARLHPAAGAWPRQFAIANCQFAIGFFISLTIDNCKLTIENCPDRHASYISYISGTVFKKASNRSLRSWRGVGRTALPRRSR